MKQMMVGFSKFQGFVEDKLNKIEMEQADLNNKLLNLDKSKFPDKTPSDLSSIKNNYSYE